MGARGRGTQGLLLGIAATRLRLRRSLVGILTIQAEDT